MSINDDLISAAMCGDFDAAMILLEAGADATAKNNEALRQALSIQRMDVIMLLIVHGADIETNASGRKAIHLAAIGNHVAVMNNLIARGVDINAKDEANETPLHIAGRVAAVECVVLLLANGADLDAVNNSGNTPLRMVEMLSEAIVGNDRWHDVIAVFANWKDQVRLESGIQGYGEPKGLEF